LRIGQTVDVEIRCLVQFARCSQNAMDGT
jgi:hypothetical protein